MTVIRLLACIQLPFQPLMSAVGMFAISKVSYGWLSRAMPWTVSKTVWSDSQTIRRDASAIYVLAFPMTETSWLDAWFGGGSVHNFSPAALGGRTNKPLTCMWCGELGTWNHCAWVCTHRPQSPVILPFSPAELTARFGWVMEGQFDATQIHGWLIIVKACVSQIHHGDLTE